MGISTRNSSSMESNTSRRQHLCSQVRSFVAGLGWSRHVSHLLETRLVKRCHKEYAENLVAGQMNGVRSEAGYVQCRFRHRVGSKPVKWLVFANSNVRGILLSSHCAELLQFHYHFPVVDCFPKSQGAKIGQQLLSCVVSFQKMVAAL
jgi:hypothetical protein